MPDRLESACGDKTYGSTFKTGSLRRSPAALRVTYWQEKCSPPLSFAKTSVQTLSSGADGLIHFVCELIEMPN